MTQDVPLPSAQSLEEANRDRSHFSGHGDAIGAAGYVDKSLAPRESLNEKGDLAVVDPQEHGYREIRIALAWDNVAKAAGGVDLDLGVLYELQDGARAAVQAFGEMFGKYDAAPFIHLLGDERTGDAPGDDETIRINGAHWPDIKRLLIYAYIYDGASRWAAVKPVVRIDVPGEAAITAQPSVEKAKLPICAIAGLENIRDGIKITHYGEFFPGHLEMDRAFGFGIAWEDGSKDKAG